MKTIIAVLVAALIATQTCSAQSSQEPIQPNLSIVEFAVGFMVIVVGGIAVVQIVHFSKSHLSLPNTYGQWPDQIYTYGSSKSELNGWWSKHRNGSAPGGGFYQNNSSGFGIWATVVQNPWTTNEPVEYSWFITETPMGGHTLFAQSQFRSDTNTMMGPPKDWGQPWLAPANLPGFTNANPPVSSLPFVSNYENASLPPDCEIEANLCEAIPADQFPNVLWARFGPRVYVPIATNETQLAYSNTICLGLNGSTDYYHTNYPCMTRSGNTLYLNGNPTNDWNWYAGWFQTGFEAGSMPSVLPNGTEQLRVWLGGNGVLQRSVDLANWTDVTPLSIVASNCTVIVIDLDAPADKAFYRMKP